MVDRFVPLQVPDDSQMVLFAGWTGGMPGFVAAIAAAAAIRTGTATTTAPTTITTCTISAAATDANGIRSTSGYRNVTNNFV